MLDCTGALAALLDVWRNDASQAPFVADLYTWSLSSGAAIRWTTADIDVVWAANSYLRGPGISRSQITRQVGTQTSEMSVTLLFDDGVVVNGVKLAQFIAGGGFFNSKLRYERAYAAKPGQAIVGTLPKFTGRMTQLQSAGESQATLVVSTNMSLLNVQVPPNVWQPPCLHTLFDAGCGLNRTAFAVHGVVQSGSDARTLFTDFSGTNGDLNLGRIDFTSGANAGQSRTIKTQSGGIIAMVRALPVAPKPGDAFTVYPGCDLTQSRCKNRFNNLRHFKGYPNIPTIETAAP